MSSSSRPQLALRLSTYRFCHGEPGRMYWGLMCCFFSQVWISWLRNSGPLSLLRYLGGLPVHSCVCCQAEMTCDERNLLPACKQRHSRLYSSHTTNIRAILPSIVRSCLKSQLQISSILVAVLTGFPVPLSRVSMFSADEPGVHIFSGFGLLVCGCMFSHICCGYRPLL